ncbi:MarR family winged helix-turn-helix transcriptional regulator [Stackebrandtia nassauensis]|uniref:Transcriptional regulator, MarR family n=1 Tax=Stackebrandtia nassauensis (strain DSM 44728 / CIP 108903 / NRRL B-16338 / NBRC 102104 / LLR-40K-21) TaxID=446470 RepID=D3PY24_STANL|nr:MarR family transcriptional regulator [Stackebrandtia nassauensis]ADD45353.1 transcriptional regulator, MarR family [Stackebrandtia nassauensis DSM 44728]
MTDSIDRHIAHWRTELPTLDPLREGVVTRMQMLVRHLQRHREAALAAHPLTSWEYDILWRLRATGPPYHLTPSHLAELLDTHPATLTNRLDRMERNGLVERVHDPSDRRRLLVALTDTGSRAWRDTIGQQDDTERDLLSGLTNPELEQLNDLLRRLVRAAEHDGQPLMPTPSDG